MANEKRTNRTRVAEIKSIISGVEMTEELRDDLITYLDSLTMAMDKRNATRSGKNAENDKALIEKIMVILEGCGKMTVTEIYKEDIDLFGSTSKVTAILKKLVDANKVIRTVSDEKGSKGKAFYELALEDEEVDE